LTSRSGQSAWFAISLANSPAQALALRERLSRLPSVGRVEDIGSIIGTAAAHPQTHSLISECRAHAEQLSQQLQYMSFPAWTSQEVRAEDLVRTASLIPSAPSPAAALDPRVAAQMQLLAKSIMQLASSQPPVLEDFPEAVRQRMASADGQTYLLRIFARENLWQRKNLGKFVKEIETVDPRVTGHPVQTWYASGELEKSYYQAGIYAFLAVAALLMIDFGSVRMVLLAMVPVGLSLLQMCGLLVWSSISFNAANMIVLPLIMGIGIDYGVHIIHDYSALGTARFRLSNSTTLAVLLTSLTTMVGFGSMGIADHRGLQSLGIVLLLGVGLCLLNSWFSLPALLHYLGPRTVRPRTSDPRKQTASSRGVASMQTSIEQHSQEQSLMETKTLHASQHANAQSAEPTSNLLLSDVPVVLSLPDYPDVRY
jgi:hypothetical protein